MRDHHQVVALPGHRYQMVVGDQQVDDLVPYPCVRPQQSSCEKCNQPLRATAKAKV